MTEKQRVRLLSPSPPPNLKYVFFKHDNDGVIWYLLETKSKTSLIDHLYKVTTPQYRSVYLGIKRSPIQYHCNDVMLCKLPNLTASLNGPFKVGPMVSSFGEVSLYFGEREGGTNK